MKIRSQSATYWQGQQPKYLFTVSVGKGNVAEYVLYVKCYRIYYDGSVREYTNLYIFCDNFL